MSFNLSRIYLFFQYSRLTQSSGGGGVEDLVACKYLVMNDKYKNHNVISFNSRGEWKMLEFKIAALTAPRQLQEWKNCASLKLLSFSICTHIFFRIE